MRSGERSMDRPWAPPKPGEHCALMPRMMSAGVDLPRLQRQAEGGVEHDVERKHGSPGDALPPAGCERDQDEEGREIPERLRRGTSAGTLWRAGHSHSHAVSADADKRALTVALGLILALMAVEVIVGILANSLALLADAAHMLTDAAALGLSLWVIHLVKRPAQGDYTSD